MADIGIILGSDSDLPKIKECFTILDEFGVSYDTIISSAHRSPQQTAQWAAAARERGIKAIIAAAGGAAHLPGVVAGHTTLPVIGIPIETSLAGGLDSLLSIVQMPSGIPVAAMPAGKAGGANAALFAVAILAATDQALAKKLDGYRRSMAEKIAQKNDTIAKTGLSAYIAKLEGTK